MRFSPGFQINFELIALWESLTDNGSYRDADKILTPGYSGFWGGGSAVEGAGAKFHPGGRKSSREDWSHRHSPSPPLAKPVELYVVDCFLLQECPENLCLALIQGAERSEVGSKLAVVIAGSQQPVGIGLADQLTTSPAIVALE